jgi:hypothetical protein
VGTISLTVNTRGYKGEIWKRAKVYSNDPRQKVAILNVRAIVKEPITFSPRLVSFKASRDAKLTKTVVVRAEADKPITLQPVRFNLEKHLAYRIEEVEPGTVFKIHFTTIPGPPGTYWGLLKLKTNHPEWSGISIQLKVTRQ